MKRIKHEEIQNSIQNYIKQRNLSTSVVSVNSGSEQSSAGKKNKNSSSQVTSRNTFLGTTKSSEMNINELNLMALNDLALIESSISSYYTFSFNIQSEQEYLKQYET